MALVESFVNEFVTAYLVNRPHFHPTRTTSFRVQSGGKVGVLEVLREQDTRDDGVLVRLAVY